MPLPKPNVKIGGKKSIPVPIIPGFGPIPIGPQRKSRTKQLQAVLMAQFKIFLKEKGIPFSKAKSNFNALRPEFVNWLRSKYIRRKPLESTATVLPMVDQPSAVEESAIAEDYNEVIPAVAETVSTGIPVDTSAPGFEQPSAVDYSAYDYMPGSMDIMGEDENTSELPMVASFEAEAAAAFPESSGVVDNAAYWESEAAYLSGLSADTSTGFDFTSVISDLSKAASGALAQKFTAKPKTPTMPVGYKPGQPSPYVKPGFMGMDTSTLMLIGGLSIGGIVLYTVLSNRKRR